MLVGVLMAAGATFLWAASAIFIRLGLREMNAGTGTLISLVIGIPFSFALALAIDPGALFHVPLSLLPALALVGALNFQMGRLLNFRAVSLAGVSRASPVMGLAPLFASILAVLFLGEDWGVFLLLGTVAIVAGLGLIVSSR